MLTIAYDENNKYVFSKEAKPGDAYFCIHCGCEMYLKRSKIGNLYFARRPGRQHTAPECRKESDNPVTRELELTNCAEFHTRLLTPPNSGGDGEKTPRPPREPRLPEERSLPIISLEELWNSGVAFAERGRTADGDISDILLCGERAIAAMSENNPLGPYALKVRPDYYFYSAQRIRFVFSVTEHGATGEKDKHYKKIFDLYLADKHKFDYYVRKIFREDIDANTHKIMIKPKYEVVLIHGNWQALPRSECKDMCKKKCDGKWKCSGYQYAEVINYGRQIHCPPSKKIM